jgi:hypothetical protein
MRQLYTLVRLHVGSATSKRGILFPEANLNDSACLASHSGQDVFSLESGDLESQIYFTSRTVSGSKSLFASDAGSHQPLPMVPCSSVARFISPAALCLGARVSSLLTPEAANRCQLPLQLRRQIYFASRTLSGSTNLFAFVTGSRRPLPTVHRSSVAKFISPAALCLGARVSSLLTPEPSNPCQLCLAAPSPNLFHQPHFVWEQNSAPLERHIGWTYK